LPDAARIIFASQRLRALLFARGGRTLNITFEFWKPEKTGFVAASGGSLRYFEERGWSHLDVSTSQNDWFLNEDTPALMQAIGAAAGAYQITICFGSSMGGYGALLYSGAARASRIITTSPQYSIDPAKVPFDRRWRNDASRADFRFDDLKRFAQRDAEALLLYDPCDELDSRHISLLTGDFPAWRAVPMWMSGHPASKVFIEAGTMSRLGDLLRETPVPLAAVAALRRQSRRQSPGYWLALAKRAGARRPALAETAVRRALACEFRDETIRFRTGALAAEAGNAAGLGLMRQAIAATPSPPAWWLWRLDQLRQRLAEADAAAAGDGNLP
jgi:hypothetical protein